MAQPGKQRSGWSYVISQCDTIGFFFFPLLLFSTYPFYLDVFIIHEGPYVCHIATQRAFYNSGKSPKFQNNTYYLLCFALLCYSGMRSVMTSHFLRE